MDPGDLLSELLHLLSAYGAGLDPDPQRLAQLKHVGLQALLNQAGCHDTLDTARSVVQALGERHASKGESNRAFERRSGVNRSTTASLLRHPSPNPKLPTLAKLAVALNYPLVVTIQNSLQEQRNPPADAGQLQSAGSVADTQQERRIPVIPKPVAVRVPVSVPVKSKPVVVPVPVPVKSKPVAVSHEVGEIGDYYTLDVQPAQLGYYELAGLAASTPTTSNQSVPSTGADAQVAQHAREEQRPVEKRVPSNLDATPSERKPGQRMDQDAIESEFRRRDAEERAVFEPEVDIIFPNLEQARSEPKLLNTTASSMPVVVPTSFRSFGDGDLTTVFSKPMRAEPHLVKLMPEETETTLAHIETPADPWRHYIFEADEEPVYLDDDNDELRADPADDDELMYLPSTEWDDADDTQQERAGRTESEDDIEDDRPICPDCGMPIEPVELSPELQRRIEAAVDEVFEKEEAKTSQEARLSREELLAYSDADDERFAEVDEFNEDHVDGRGSDSEAYFEDEGSEEQEDEYRVAEDSTADEEFEAEEHDEEYLLADASVESESEFDETENYADESYTHLTEDSTESELDSEFAEDSDTLDFAEDSTEPEYEEYDAEEYAEYDAEVDAEGSTEPGYEESDAYHLSDDSTAVDEGEEYVEDKYEDEDEEYVEDEYEADDSPEYDEAYAGETHGRHRYGDYSSSWRSRARSVADEYRRRGKPFTHAQEISSQPAVDAEPIEKLPRNLQTGAIEKHQPKVAVKAGGVALGTAVGLSVTGRGLLYTTGAGVLTAIAAAYSRDSHARDFMLYSGVSTAVSSVSKAIYEYHKKNSK